MKKLVLLISMSLFTLTSCSDNSNNETVPTNSDASIIGIWKFKKSETYSNKDSNKLIDSEEDECSQKTTIEFTESNKFKALYRYTENNECFEQSPVEFNYKYDSENKRIYLRDRADKYSDVIELTENSLIFAWSEGDMDEDGKKDYIKQTYYR